MHLDTSPVIPGCQVKPGITHESFCCFHSAGLLSCRNLCSAWRGRKERKAHHPPMPSGSDNHASDGTKDRSFAALWCFAGCGGLAAVRTAKPADAGMPACRLHETLPELPRCTSSTTRGQKQASPFSSSTRMLARPLGRSASAARGDAAATAMLSAASKVRDNSKRSVSS